MLQVELQWGIERLTLPTQALCQKWVDASLLKEDHSIELTIRIVSAQESQALNKAYRHKDKPTNVLSFEFEPPIGLPVEALEGGGEKIYLGDLAICAEVVKQEALAQHKTLEAHWAHMIVHGALHLQGLDHIEAEDALEMEALEIKIMRKLGYANPYEI
jgi:probable rRNA maturation factor